MPICPSGCAVDVVAMPAGGCKITTRPGGLFKFVFAKCDIAWTDITDTAEWETKITANEVHASGQILGSKPKGSATKAKLASCLPERVTGYTRSINFKDFNADTTATLGDYDFWAGIDSNQDLYLMGFVTCDDLFYGWYGEWALDVDDVRPESSDEAAYFEGVIEYKELALPKPQLIAGLGAVLA